MHVGTGTDTGEQGSGVNGHGPIMPAAPHPRGVPVGRSATMGRMSRTDQPVRPDWVLAGLFSGAVALVVGYAAAMIVTLHVPPLTAVARWATFVVPEFLHVMAEKYLGTGDRAALLLLLGLATLVLGGLAGALWAHRWWWGGLLHAVAAAVTAAAVLDHPGHSLLDLLPVGLALLGAWGVLAMLGHLLHRHDRWLEAGNDADGPLAGRRTLLGTGLLLVLGAGGLGVLGHEIGDRRRHVAESRGLLRLSKVTAPEVPAEVRIPGVPSAGWATATSDFFVQHTTLAVPTVEPAEWQLRVHGMVERELVLTYDDLLAEDLHEAWVTLGCVRNPVGGDKVGNAWWSGVRIADVLARAGVSREADAVVQTSADGWTCQTPLGPLTDGRDAILAVAMNGEALPIEHGFPVRTVVPGLQGHVSACKWVVDLEVTRAAPEVGWYAERGWESHGVVPLGARIDAPADGETVPSGQLLVRGLAWASRAGVSAVEVAVDGGAWQRARLGGVPGPDTWVPWAISVVAEPGDHQVRVRTVDGDGRDQTGVRSDPKPGPARGWHTIEYRVEDA